MAYFYMNTDVGSDANNGSDWTTNAKLTLEGLISVMSAGDIGCVQGAADDTAAATRTLTSPGTNINPCLFLGCKDGTTNTGTSIVESDLSTTPNAISNTGSASDIVFNGAAVYVGFDFTTADRWSTGVNSNITFVDCIIDDVDRFQQGVPSKTVFLNTDIDVGGITGYLIPGAGAKLMWKGGTYIQSTAPTALFPSCQGEAIIKGVDLSALTVPIATACTNSIKVLNCRMPTSYTVITNRPANGIGSVEIIGSSNATGIANDSSVQDYTKEDTYGTIDVEVTNVRTGAADDGASGVFCYAMTPGVNLTKESTGALKSPWLSTWVTGGSSLTCTVYIANDGGVDYNEDDVWVEWITPDDGDTAQHDVDIPLGRFLDNSTAVTDDTVSSWVTAANPQKFVKTFTPGYEGWVQARVHFAKRFAATPDTLYLDPKIDMV
jgi:hypothetical protein